MRRNGSTQYISYPHFPKQKLRKETAEKYEAYVDLEVGKWTKIKIAVQDTTAKLYVHDAGQPTLLVSDLKHGAEHNGAAGRWIGSGTEAHFRKLIIAHLLINYRQECIGKSRADQKAISGLSLFSNGYQLNVL